MDVTQKDLDLLAVAAEAMEKAHSPYSRIRVGAAVRTRDGRIFPGCNLENASLGLTMCAERVALGNAYAQGARDVETVALTSNHPDVASPCGACRQVLLELAPGARIVFGGGGRIHKVWESPRALLPDSMDGSWNTPGSPRRDGE